MILIGRLTKKVKSEMNGAGKKHRQIKRVRQSRRPSGRPAEQYKGKEYQYGKH